MKKFKTVFCIYDAVNCNPNGDPDNGGVRYDEINKKCNTSDLRIKRYSRDGLNDFGIDTFYQWDRNRETKGGGTGSENRFVSFLKEKNIDKNDAKKNPVGVLVENFIDIRMFGGIVTSKDYKANVTGCFQYNAVSQSINNIIDNKNLIDRGITTIFPSKIKKDNQQGSMGRDQFIKYGLFSIRGDFNPNIAKINKVKEDDLKLTLLSFWNKLKTINTRSKRGQEPIAIIVINHPSFELNNGHYLGNTLSQTFKPFELKLNVEKSEDILSRDDYEFDFSPLIDLSNNNKVTKNVEIYCDDIIKNKYFNNLDDKFNIINPFNELLNILNVK